MTFEEILPFFKKGEKIKRRSCDKDCYLYLKDDIIFNHTDYVVHLSGYDLISDDWEVYEEPIDWKFIIDNRCLCWFWDDDYSYRSSGELILYESEEKLPFACVNGSALRTRFKHCKPVESKEITFYEEKKKC